MPKVEAAVVLDELALEYSVEMTPEEARAFFMKALSKGEDPARVLVLIGEVDRLMPRMEMGPNNPNTGRKAHRYVVGREGSRVLYVRYVRAYASLEASAGLSLRVMKLNHGVTVQYAGVNRTVPVGASEVHDRSDDGEVIVRFWWD